MYMPPNLHWSSTCKRASGKSGAEQRVISDRKSTSRVTFVTHIPGVPRLLVSGPKQVNLRAFQSFEAPGSQDTLAFWDLLGSHRFVLEQALPRGLGLSSYPRLIGQKTKVLPPLSWDYSNLPCSAFYMDAEAQSQVTTLVWQALWTELSP